MTTCLDDLKVVLEGIQAALDGGEFGSNVSVSLKASAQSGAQSVSISQAIAIATAFAQADAISIALNFVDVDVRVEQTSIVELILPPLSNTEGPDLTDYPAASTGVTGTWATIGATGEMCQLVYQYVLSVAKFFELLQTVSAPILAASAAVMLYLELNLKAIALLGLKLPIPKQSIATIAALISGWAVESDSPMAQLQAVVDSLSDSTVQANLACIAWNEMQSGGTTYDAARAIQGAIETNYGSSWNVFLRGAVLTMFGPSTFAAAMYLPEYWSVPTTSYDCSSCLG